jgi:hypothetical protein
VARQHFAGSGSSSFSSGSARRHEAISLRIAISAPIPGCHVDSPQQFLAWRIGGPRERGRGFRRAVGEVAL